MARGSLLSSFYVFLTSKYRGRYSNQPLTHRAALDVCSGCRTLERRFDIEIEYLVATEFDLSATLEAIPISTGTRNLRRAARLYHAFYKEVRTDRRTAANRADER